SFCSTCISRFTIQDHKRMTAGVECRKDADVIDEAPAAYKSIDAVMAAQINLVDIVHTHGASSSASKAELTYLRLRRGPRTCRRATPNTHTRAWDRLLNSAVPDPSRDGPC